METLETISTQILIVGGGPTGLTLANILGQGGIDFVLVDRKPSTIGEPRAVSIDDESLRVMQSVGLAEPVMRDVVPGYGVHYMTRLGGRCFGRVEPTASDYGFPRRNAFRQPLFEATVRQGLKRFDMAQVWFGHNLDLFEQDASGVTATVARSDGSRVLVRAQFMVACDGGRSPVRESLGIPMTGSTFASRWLVIDTEQDDDRFSQMRVYCDPQRPVVDVPGPHRTRRFEILIHPAESADEVMQPERTQALLRPFRGERTTHIVRKVVYTFHARMAERWQQGRIFLAGDAAHLTPPYAGQGMNSGIRDAANLGWKLVSVLRGQIAEATLQSYEIERRGHAWALIRLALNLGRVMAPSSRFSAWCWQSFFSFATTIPPLRDYFLQMKFKPKPRFSDGILGPTDRPAKHSLRGRMFPQPQVSQLHGATAMLDDLIGQGFALLLYGDVEPEVLSNLREPLWSTLEVARVLILPAERRLRHTTVELPGVQIVVDTANALSVTLGVHQGKIIVLRPDRYVAGVFAAQDESQFALRFAGTLGISQQTPRGQQRDLARVGLASARDLTARRSQ